MNMQKMSLSERLALLESVQTGDTVPGEQVRELVNAVKEMFGIEKSPAGSEIYQELGELAKFINTAKKELQETGTGEIAEQEIPTANNQLDAILAMTEQATGTIMDACDQLTTLHDTLRGKLASATAGHPGMLAELNQLLDEAGTSITGVYEACNFQDVTGQRIQKVIKVLKEIERKVLRMVVVFGLIQNSDKLDDASRRELQEEAVLLNGPQLPGQGMDQDDIDAMLAKLL